jgi:hypothetical protein
VSERARIPIGVPPGTRVLRIERVLGDHWMIWLHTSDYTHGTFLRLYDNGAIERVTVRADEGDDVATIKPMEN